MGATSATSHDDGGAEPPGGRVPGRDDSAADAPTRQMLASTVGDRCVACEAPLASDQRYCGERRGKARFSFASVTGRPAEAPAAATEPHRPRMGSGSTLVAGVGTLLLALGVGVLIGHTANSTPTRVSAAPAPQVITVGGGGGGTRGGAAATKAAKTTKIVSPKIHLSQATAAKASAAAAKVLGGAAPKQPTITVGQACVAGQQGCMGGKFTGSFFGQ